MFDLFTSGEMNMNSYRIGPILANYRKTHNLTIKEFSAQTGLSTALLSELERNIGNPTLSVLDTLADAMGMSISALLEREISNHSLVRRKEDRCQVNFPDTQNLYDVLSVSPVRSKLQLLLLELEPGMTSNRKMSVHPYFEEIAYMISGAATVLFEHEEISLYEGDSIRILPGRRHTFQNRSQGIAMVLFAQEVI